MQYRIYKDQQKISETTNKQFTVQNLRPKTTYTFSVSAYNGAREGTRANLTMTTRGLVMEVEKTLTVGADVDLLYQEYALGLVPLGTEPEGMFGGGNKQNLVGRVISSENGISQVEIKTNFDKLPDQLKMRTDLQVPGINLLKGSLNFKWPEGVGQENVTPSYETQGDATVAHLSSQSNGGIYTKWGKAFPNGELQVGDDYTLSFDAKGLGMFIAVGNESGNQAVNSPISNTSLTSDWKRYSVSGKISALNKAFVIYFKGNYDVYLKCVKVEKGTQPTPWSPAREDIYGTTKVDESYSGFNGYKAIYLK